MAKTIRQRRPGTRADRVARRRAKSRKCGECTACNQEPPCGWTQGLLGDIHRPDLWGMILEGKRVPTTTRRDGTLLLAKDVFCFREVIENVRQAETVRQVLSGVALHVPIMVADIDGRIISVLGPAAEADALIEQLGKDPKKIETSVSGEATFDHIPENPL